MNRMALITFIVLVLLCGLMDQGFAQERPVRVAGVDIRPLVEYLREHTEILKTPVHVYSYSDGSRGSGLRAFSALAPFGYETVRKSAGSYWTSQGASPGGNQMGYGFYAAIDPVHTRKYGGPDWLLTRIELPVGTRLLQTKVKGVPSEVVDIADRLGCRFTSQFSNDERELDGLETLMGPKVGSSKECLQAIGLAADVLLKIDALVYFYTSNLLSDCKGDRKAAFVFTSARRLKPEQVRVFNRFTRDEREERLRIESLFYKSTLDMANDSEERSAIISEWAYKVLPKKYPGKVVSGIGVDPHSEEIKYTFNMCPPGSPDFDGPGCVVVPAPALPKLAYPAKISKRSPAILSSSVPEEPLRLRFADLDGEMTDPGLSNWIQQSLYGCSATPQTEKLR